MQTNFLMASAKSQNKLPREFNLCAGSEAFDLTIEAAKDGDNKKSRRFDMDAYNGGLMRVGGFWHPVVVDLSGLDISQKNKPILLEHKPSIENLLGQTDSIKVANNKLTATGKIFLTDNADTKVLHVVKLADAGYQWQASIGARIEEYTFIQEKENVTCNGQTFNGPCYYISKSTLGEISFVMLGADESTSADIAAKNNVPPSVKENQMKLFKEWLSAMGLDYDKMGEAQRTALKAQFDIIQASAGNETNGNTPAKEPETKVEAKSPVVTDINAGSVVDDIRAQAAAEQDRIAKVTAVCNGEHADILSKAISEGWTEDKTELTVLRASRKDAPNVIIGGSSVSTGPVLEAAAMMAGGISGDDLLKTHGDEVVATADKRFHGRIGLQQLLMEAARANGCSVVYFSDDPRKVMEAAFSTMDLSGILGNTANKFLANGFDSVEKVYEKISSYRSVKDFKQITSYRLNGGFLFDEIGPDGELKHATTSEDSFTNQAKTYGKMFGITRTDLINDDLGALTVVPFKIGRGGNLKLNLIFWAAFLNNSTFFTSGRGNYASGAGSALGIDGLTAAELLFRNQTDPDGNPAAISPSILLVPNAKYRLAKQLMVSTTLKGSTDGPDSNTFEGDFDVEVSSYLSNSGLTGYSAAAWYLLADPKDMPVIERVYLNGVQRPTVESADADFNTLGIQLRGFFDFGVEKQEHRGGVKSNGS